MWTALVWTTTFLIIAFLSAIAEAINNYNRSSYKLPANNFWNRAFLLSLVAEAVILTAIVNVG